MKFKFDNLKIIKNNTKIIEDRCVISDKCHFPKKLSQINSKTRKKKYYCYIHNKTNRFIPEKLIIILQKNHKNNKCVVNDNQDYFCSSCETKSRFIFTKQWNECYWCYQEKRKYEINGVEYEYWDYPCEHKIINISNDKFIRILIYLNQKNYNYFVYFLVKKFDKKFKFRKLILENIDRQDLRKFIYSKYYDEKQEYYIDFETNSYKKLLVKNLLQPSVWLVGIMKKNNNPENNWKWYNWYEFLEFFKNIKKSQKWYFHNLSFDARYLIKCFLKELNYKSFNPENLPLKKDIPVNSYWFLTDEEKIIYKGYFKNSNNNIVEIECTFLKFGFSIKKIGKMLEKMKNHPNYKALLSKYEVTKGDIDYRVIRPLDWNIKNEPLNSKNKTDYGKKVINYLFRDLIIIKLLFEITELDINKFLEKYQKNIKFEWKMTISATAIWLLKNNFMSKEKWNRYFSKNLNADEFNIVRESYRGGPNFCTPQYLNKKVKIGDKIFVNGKYEIVKKINIVDINGSFMFAYSKCPIPTQKPIYGCEEECNHWSYYQIKNVKNLKLNKGHFPIFSERSGKQSMLYTYPHKSSFDNRIFNSMFLELFKEIYSGEYEIKKLICFEQEIIPELSEYADFLNDLKNYAKDIGNEILQQIAKTLAVAPYGKMAQNYRDYFYFFDENLNLEKKEIEIDESKLWYAPFADAATTYSHLNLYNTGYQIGWDYIPYVDTDSEVVLKELDKNMEYKCIVANDFFKGKIFDEKELGKWKFVYKDEIEEFRNFGKKKYYVLFKNGNLEIKTAGLPKEITDMIANKDYAVFCDGKEIENNVDILDIHTQFTNAITKNQLMNGVHVFDETNFTYKNNHKSYFLSTLNRWNCLDNDWKKHISDALPRFFKSLEKDINYWQFIEKEYKKDYLFSFIKKLENQKINLVKIDIKQNNSISLKDSLYYSENYEKNLKKE